MQSEGMEDEAVMLLDIRSDQVERGKKEEEEEEEEERGFHGKVGCWLSMSWYVHRRGMAGMGWDGMT